MAYDNFTPEIWSAHLLENFKNDLVFASPNVVNHDYQSEIIAYGDTVRINSIGGVTVSDYSKNQAPSVGSRQILSSSQQSLVIDRAKMFHVEIDDIDQVQNQPNVMANIMAEAAFSLGNELDGYLSGLIAAAVPSGNALGNITVATASNVYEAFVDLARKLDENNAPPQGRYAVVNPLVFSALLKDTRFVSFGTEANRATISNRVVGTVAGFVILVSNQIPNGTTVLAGSARATTLAEQINKLEVYRPEDRFADAMKGLHVYGAKVIRPEFLASFVAA